MNPKHYHVQTPAGSFTWIGGETQPAGENDVWLCSPRGERVLRVPADCVRPTTRDETPKRIQADLRTSKAPLN